MAKAAAAQMETARGTIEVVVPETEPGKGPTKVTKGPMSECVVKGGVMEDKDGNCVLVCGMTEKAKQQAMREGSL